MQKGDSKGAELTHNHKKDILLEVLLKYVIPLFNKNKTKANKKEGKLEELVKKERTELKPLELIFLEDLIDSFMRDNANNKNSMKKIRKLEPIGFLELETNNKNNETNEDEIRYFIALERKKEQKGNVGYSIEIKYEENETEEKLSIGIKFSNANDSYSLDKKAIKDNKKINEDDYSITLKKEKDKQNKIGDNYSVSLVYENDYEKERLSINYKSTIGAYMNKRQQALHDFSDRVPGKHVDIFPANMMGSVLGFTYLGQGYMALRDDLIGKTKKMVDIHESIHTPDEYETRILTDWIMARPNSRYIK